MKEAMVILKNKPYRNLLLATFTSKLGSTIGSTAILFYVLKKFSEQPFWATWIDLMYVLPVFLIFLFTGSVVDHFDRKKIAYYSDVICLILSLGLLLAVETNWMPIVLAFLFVRRMVNAFLPPSESAIVQGVVGKDDYGTALGINQTLYSLLDLFGKGIGIFFFWKIGVQGAIVVDAVTFGISAFLIYQCKIPEEVRLPNGKTSIQEWNYKVILKQFKEAVSYVKKQTKLKKLLSGFMIFGVINASLAIIPLFYLKYKLSPGSYEEISVWQGVFVGSGLLLGSVSATYLSKKISSLQMICGGLMISGIIVIAVSFSTSVWIYLPLMFLAEGILPCVSIGINSLIFSMVQPEYMGRFVSCLTPMMTAGRSIVLFFISYSYPKIFSIESLFWLTGGFMLLFAIYYAWTFSQKTDTSL